MLTPITQFTDGAADLIAVFLLLSGMSMLILILASWLYVFSVVMGGTSRVVDACVTVFAFVLNKLWMVSMLQMVALYTGIGGVAVSAIAVMELLGNKAEGVPSLIAMLIGALVGSVSLSGSLVAWTKLNGVVEQALWARGQRAVSLAVMLTALAVGSHIVFTAQAGSDQLIATPGLTYLLVGSALLFGASMTLPIGREQMPVVISIYNACTGLAVGLEGFALRSPTLVIGGIVVGTSRMLLTLFMERHLLGSEMPPGQGMRASHDSSPPAGGREECARSIGLAE